MRKRNIIILTLIIIIIIIILLLRSCDNKQIAEIEDKELKYQPYSSEQDSIKIPAIESLSLQADKIPQNVTFENPADNNCYFRISVLLSDETMIYQSNLIKPEEKITEINLTQTLKRGVYSDCLIIYDCFSLEDQSDLNSAEIKIKIYSK